MKRRDALLIPMALAVLTGGATVVSAQSTPYGGTPVSVPGTIQAENFDEGGSGVAYYDNSPGNAGGVYRSTCPRDRIRARPGMARHTTTTRIRFGSAGKGIGYSPTISTGTSKQRRTVSSRTRRSTWVKTVGGLGAGSYAYDADNWRVRKSDGQNTSFYIRGVNNELADRMDEPGGGPANLSRLHPCKRPADCRRKQQ